jgi:hypothetical protein
MSTRLVGFRSDKDPIFQKQVKVLLACLEAGIEKLPTETAAYFGSEYPEKYLIEEALSISIPKKEWSADMQEGYEILVKDIPQGVEVIRFYNSY